MQTLHSGEILVPVSYYRDRSSRGGTGVVDLANVHALFLVFGKDHVKPGLRHIYDFFDRCCADHESHILIIDNAMEDGLQASIDNYRVVSGDNTCLDFSGWEKGFSFLADCHSLSDEDILIFCNDSFFRSYSPRVIDGFRPGDITPGALHDRIAGFVDRYSAPVSILGYKFDRWIRSNFFVMTLNTFKKLDGLVFPLPPEKIFSAHAGQFFSGTLDVSDDYRANLNKWLFGEEAGCDMYMDEWHGATGLDRDNIEFFRKKARAILSEQFLSVKIANKGLGILEINGRVMPQYRY